MCALVMLSLAFASAFKLIYFFDFLSGSSQLPTSIYLLPNLYLAGPSGSLRSDTNLVGALLSVNNSSSYLALFDI